jgi:hypothetical protein
MRKFRINPSLLISMVALFVALGGVSYAAATIGSAQIKNNSVQSKDVKNGNLRGKDLKADTIGGSRVLESSLGKVPSAANADAATKATSADTATSATSAASAANADNLDGVDGAQYVRVKTRVRAISDTSADVDYVNDANLAQLSNLAAGQYTVTAKLQVDNDSAGDEVIDCDLIRNSGVLTQLDSSEQDLGANAASAQELNYVLMGTFTAGAAGTDDLFLRCEQQGADNDADEMRIIATLVN